MIARAAFGLGGLAAGMELCAQARPSVNEIRGASPRDPRTSLRRETTLKAAPQRIYEALLDSRQFAAFSGLPADVDPRPGGAFTLFGGLIVGRNVELTLNTRIVQAWRPTHWEPSVYSIVRFDLESSNGGTRVVLDHTGFPEGEYDHLYSGWTSHYFDPLKKSLT
jgi:activator of HSP90 ATPase